MVQTDDESAAAAGWQSGRQQHDREGRWAGRQACMHKEQEQEREQEREQPMLWANQSSLSIWFQLDQHQCDTGEVD